ncbi:NAD(P)/FAD-dependent oxidoreductase [Verminephrobacter aporrectodeae]|uniref:NAD(P)/FAD-dependent oxidoreductase n=1 Tax=Verminephrobacter aporrectodeae TaxID=1110389 RepID=UPI002242E83A|nr:FAD-dependent oxidoreductase [Verminephrobacter aporrectodeae]MCW8176472.1 FAD-binding oxidoreductase [Verminephrobacter aporrectodeae subsp. tuberculatae]MCW8204159.1 FAD-binding oxidoreductase [Verminephrobacter aporrectodeae subsp. tuberculatae]
MSLLAADTVATVDPAPALREHDNARTRPAWGEPYWKVEPSAPLATQLTKHTCDIAIVGGGLTGLITALLCAQQGASVTVLDAATPGAGASGRNAGFVTPGLTSSHVVCKQRYGEAVADALWRFSIDAVDETRQLIADQHIDCGLRRTGRLTLANTRAHHERMRRWSVFSAERFQTQLSIVDQADVPAYTSVGDHAGGMLDPTTLTIDSGRYVSGLVDRATAAGVTIVTDCEVREIGSNAAPGDHRFVLKTGLGELRANTLVLAINGYMPGLESAWRRQVIPVGSGLIACAPLPDEARNWFSPRGLAIETSENFKRYARLLPDGGLLFGGRDSLLPPESQKSSARLEYRLRDWLGPAFEHGMKISHAWPGRLGFTSAQLPILAQSDGVYFAGGYCGHGIPFSNAFGQRLARWITSGERPDTPFAHVTHRALPARSLTQPLLAMATLYYRGYDHLERIWLNR